MELRRVSLVQFVMSIFAIDQVRFSIVIPDAKPVETVGEKTIKYQRTYVKYMAIYLEITQFKHSCVVVEAP
jgi:hypothetical protein